VTRKHFELIARRIRSEWEEARLSDDLAGQAAIEALARGLAWDLQETNPLFDRGRFLEASIRERVSQ
jgi:hypothetical protein